jgi:hypothetical protein
MDDTIEERLTAVERAVTDGDHDLADLATAAETGERLADLDAEMQTLDERVAELEAATQALRGYVGNVRAVNEEIEQRADLALQKAEAAIDAAEDVSEGPAPGAASARDGDSLGDRSMVDREAADGDVAGSRHPPSRATPQQHKDCVCGEAGASAQAAPDDSDTRPDPAALANANRERATDGGTTETPTDATEDVSIFARIRDFV